MLMRRFAPAVVIHTPAKVNLFLEVLARRADGYHDLATLMVPVGLYDTLEFREAPAGSLELWCDAPSLSTGPDNLVTRAAVLLRQHGGRSVGASIRLWKRIPMQAGLAGGSSDAAATLIGLNALWRLGLGRGELAVLGAALGSDVPFFLAGSAAWCTGRGEQVERIPLARPLDFVLASPAVGLSTADVFRNVTVPADPLDGTELRQAALAGNVEELGRRLFNRLQPVAERLCPPVGDLHRRLIDLHPAGCLMTGSGTTVFALCRDAGEALRIARGLRSAQEGSDAPRTHCVQSCF
jgi:4-diphosphocytidyl-2-C-methyl-D-erythritol kinase